MSRIVEVLEKARWKPNVAISPLSFDRKNPKQIKTKLGLLRAELKLSQKEFAEKLGIYGTAYSRYENGDHTPFIKTWVKMKQSASLHGITLTDDLFDRIDNNN